MSAEGLQPETSLLTSEPLTWYDRAAAWVADHCHPIVIKECRQALKSRQFLWTYLLLLLAVVIWSFWGLSFPFAESSQLGARMLQGYLFLLGVPCLLIVPLGAFRSLANELETETLPQLKITTLSPRGIIAGKLASSMLQLGLYLSIVTPCIAFTYLLQGVDLAQVGLLVWLKVVMSVSLSALGLLGGALSGQTMLRWLIALVMIVMFLIATYLTLIFEWEVVSFWRGNSEEFRSGLIISIVLIASLGWLSYCAAAALISFPASDRSSPIRRALILSHLALIASFGLVGELDTNLNWPAIAAALSAHYWLFFGSLTSSENPGLSERVRRELPRSVVGQSVRGLLMPGPGRGYLFALTQLWGWAAVLCLLNLLKTYQAAPTNGFGGWLFGLPLEVVNQVWYFAVNAAHATLYLSLNWMVVTWIRGERRMSPLIGLVTMLLTFVLVHVITLSLHGFFRGNNPYSGYNEYSMWLAGNWWWWYSEVRGGAFGTVLGEVAFANVSTLVSLAAGSLAAVCIFRACRELVAQPGRIPERVLAELAARRKVEASPGESIAEILAARTREPSGDEPR